MNNRLTALVLDDEVDFRENVAEFLTLQGYKVFQAGDVESGWSIIQEQDVQVALVDVVLPDQSGLTLLSRARELEHPIEIVMITGETSISTAVEAMRQGAFHYISKPLRLEELDLVVKRAFEKSTLLRENQLQREGLRRRGSGPPKSVIAISPAMHKLYQDAGRIALTESTVMIHGETGVGKEVIAEFIYQNSPRRERILSVVNAGALAENLIDTELFGHEKGAFTGATEAHLGLIEISDRGTLFLDEIGDIPASAQVRFLRFLESGKIRRIGATRELELDVRIITATYKDLDQEVREGRFREDLYHRLDVFQLRVPPLRERQEDIIPLAEYFLTRHSPDALAVPTLDDSAQAALLGYHWPGNVRELTHVMERAALSARFADSNEVSADYLNLAPSGPERGKKSRASLKEVEIEHVKWMLQQMGENRKKTAEALGISERQLYRIIQSFSN